MAKQMKLWALLAKASRVVIPSLGGDVTHEIRDGWVVFMRRSENTGEVHLMADVSQTVSYYAGMATVETVIPGQLIHDHASFYFLEEVALEAHNALIPVDPEHGHALATHVPCAECGVSVGVRCKSNNLWPHSIRLKAACLAAGATEDDVNFGFKEPKRGTATLGSR